MRWWMLVNELWWQLSCPRNWRVHWVRWVGNQSMVMMHVMWHVGRRRRVHRGMEFSRVRQYHHFPNSVFFHHLSCNRRNEQVKTSNNLVTVVYLLNKRTSQPQPESQGSMNCTGSSAFATEETRV